MVPMVPDLGKNPQHAAIFHWDREPVDGPAMVPCIRLHNP